MIRSLLLRVDPILQRGSLRVFLECTEEIPKIVITAFQTDLRDGQVCLFEQAHGLLDTVFINIFHRCPSDGFLEEAAEILLIHMDLIGKVLDIYLLFIILPYISKYLFEAFYTFVQIPLGRCKELIMREDGKNAQKVGFDE